MNYSRTTVVAIFIVCGTAANAAPASDASVRKLVEVMNVQEQLADAMGQIKTMMRAQMVQALEKATGKLDDPETKALLDEFMDDTIAVIDAELSSPEMLADLTKVYAGVFTEEEVQAQIKFYTTPVGRKVIERGPELMKATIAMMQLRMPAMQARLMEVGKEFQAKVLELKAKQLREQPAATPETGKKP